ncbi:IkappaB kinase complex IKAP component [Abortiporus biennis]|nr:IkappaB kinase complex IKAP component [Abortiporus biennis]
MRNLSLFRNVSTAFPDSAAISAVTVDLDQDILYVASEKENQDGDVNVAIWRTFIDSRIEFYRDTSSATLLATFTSPAYSTSNPWSVTTRPAEIVFFRLLPDSRNLVFIMRGGEIATANLEDETLAVEVVGSFESGILAASWSPDDTVLVLATGDAKLILMTPDFDVISETSLHPTDFGEDAPINVGWGSKQTQFHGSLGKAAAQAPKPQNIGSSPDDDQLPRITWRGDGAYFAVSSLSPSPTAETNKPELRHRTFRVYSHIGALQSTSEPTPGLEHVLSWRPSGNWIVSTQRYGFEGGGLGREGRHDLVMFERNGLRRSDFVIEKLLAPNQTSEHTSTVRKWGYRMREVSWSSDSNILSLWIEKDSGDIVQLWTIGNYHWYLKHEIVAPSGPHGEPGRLTSVIWHPEDATKLILTTPTHVIQRTYIWETNSSPSKPPQDSGSVAVLDGDQQASILLTPFRSQNVPPPMSSYQLSVPFDSTKLESIKTRIPVNMSFSRERDILALIWETGYAEIIDLHTRLVPGREKIMDPVKLWSGLLSPDSDVEYRQIVHWVSDSHQDEIVRIGALGTGSREVITIFSIAEGEVKERANISISTRNGRLLSGGGQLFLQTPDGEILSRPTVDVDSESTSPVSNFPEFCYDSHASQAPSKSDPDTLFIGLSQGGKLYAADSRANHLLVANANSFTLASGFLVYTTSAHVSHYAPLDALPYLLQQRAMNRDALPPMPEWETRRVERGSRIVTAVPSAMSLVLQMPRGNLETINPRPLVMKIVKQDIDRGQYAKAFSSCRRHRVDLNVFVEHNKDAFISNLASFVEQVDDVDYINLFLTSVGQGSMSPEVIAQVCDGVRAELEKKDLKKYVNSILTAHVVKQPPDHEAGLALLLRLRDTEPQVVEDAVKYIIFLVDADRLFDTALGMYDFSLVLMIAQHAQKDPREYLPFLRELRALEKFYQRFKIDDHLKRYEKALKNLSLTGDDHFDEAMDYVEKHQLYDAALSIWKETNHYDTVLSTYGDWLFERREFRHAGFVFTQAQKYEKAMVAYEKALDWQELFALAVQQQASEEDLADMAYRVAEDLSSKKRYQEEARVLLDYRQDVRGAIFALVQGNQFSEARRLSDLLEDVVYPAALESRSQLSEELSEMKDQLRKQVARLRELRVKKVEEPDAFFGVEDTDLHNVDVMTDISMAPTAFTRYTVAASAISKTSSKRSSRSKRKLERKVGSGRKGTVDEEEYLLKSVTKLVGKFNNAQADAVNLLPHLFQFTEKHREEGLELQQEIVDFAQELQLAVEEIWKKVEREGEPTTPEGWAARMQEIEKQRQIDPLDKVAKPELTKRDWNTKLSSL